MNPKIIVYCDESAKKGSHFSNFYGASLVLSEHVFLIEKSLSDAIVARGLTCEIKWNNISPSTFERFIEIIDIYFDFVANELVKFRCMFTQNIWIPIGLTSEQHRNAYFLLYYQFIKNGLGLSRYNRQFGERNLQLIFDQFPRNKSQISDFKKNVSLKAK